VLRAGGQLWCWGERPGAAGTEGIDYSPRRVPAPEPLLELRTLPRAAAKAAQAPPGLSAPSFTASPATSPSLVDRSVTGGARAEAAICARGASGWLCLGERGLQPQAAFRREGVDDPVLARGALQPARVGRDGRCGVTSAGSLVCALPSRQPAPSPAVRRALKRFETPEGFVEATSVFPLRGVPHVCGRTGAGHVECFSLEGGASPAASLARDSAGARRLSALDGIVQVDAAASGEGGAACALDAAGSVWCWGVGRWGQRPGAGTEGPLEEPLPIGGLPPIARVVVGNTFACALAAGGRVYCWGSNRNGGAPDGAPGVAREAQRVQLPR
jgi:Regulator of Chromosome Condensation (RCC1) repeat protein